MRITASIICYNYGRFLQAAIDSVLAQNLPPNVELEILIVDDGSTDETMDVCAMNAPRVRVSRSKNLGFGASLTRAIEAASGEYVFLLDADDLFGDGKIARVVETLTKDLLYVEHRQTSISEFGQPLPGIHAGGNTSTLCVQRKAAMDLLPVENEVAFHALNFAGKGTKLNEPLGIYRIHGSSMTQRNVPGKQNEYLAGVHSRLSERFRNSSSSFSWMTRAQMVSFADRYFAMAQYNYLEAALERGEAFNSFAHLLMLVCCILRRPTLISKLYLKMVVKTFLGRPSFRR